MRVNGLKVSGLTSNERKRLEHLQTSVKRGADEAIRQICSAASERVGNNGHHRGRIPSRPTVGRYSLSARIF